MLSTLPWIALAGPLALIVAGLVAGARAPQRAIVAAWLALIVAAGAAAAVAFTGPIRTGTLGVDGIGFGVYLDTLSVVMVVLVAFVGLIVVRYSRNYLAGDPGQPRFARWLCLTLAAVLTLIVAGNMFQLLLAWVATSLSLNRLLVFYPNRVNAVLAARKKFVASRIGDACIVAAMVLLYARFGSLDYAALFAGFAAGPGAAAPAALLVVAALLKSAQFPTHGWLIEVMETPTPVSALLHAGVINAGGFLVLRFSGLIVQSVPVMDLLVVAGGITALFGSLVMLTQTSVKVALAWSTIAQMGFMMLECGLGAFSAALLHIVAHSLYKAHAFLASGSVVDLARAAWSPAGTQPHPWRTALAIGVVLVAASGVAALFGATVMSRPGVFALGAVLLLALTHYVAQALDADPSPGVLARVAIRVTSVVAAFVALQWAAERATAGVLPAVEPLRGPFDLAIVAVVVAAFAAVTILQGMLPKSRSDRALALHVHLANGFYINTVANRLALRLWPNLPRRVAARGLISGETA